MQILRTIRWHPLLAPLLERGSARQSAGHDVATAGLRFHDREIRLAGNRNEVVRRAAFYWSVCSEMKRHRDLVHRLSVELHRPHAAANECARFDRAAQTDDRNVIAVLDLQFARELGRDFGEKLRL